MGYYTDFKLKVSDKSAVKNIDLDQLMNDLEEVTHYEFENDIDHLTLPDAKWYDYEDNMKTLTKMPKYKDVLFTLSGSGEEKGDIWMAIARNGAFIFGTTKIVYVFDGMEISSDF